jgi:hypothetical protein
MKTERDGLKYLAARGLDNKLTKMWQGYHFSARLKLEAASHFCEQLQSAATMPDDIGLPLLVHSEFKWYDAFFFELLSAYEILLQELNIVLASHLNLGPEEVSWPAIRDALPGELADYMTREWSEPWFDKLRKYRDTATHHSHLLASSWKPGSPGGTWDYDTHKIAMFYYDDDTEKTVIEYTSECAVYLQKMAGHLSRVWGEMAKAFDTRYVPPVTTAYMRPYVEGS